VADREQVIFSQDAPEELCDFLELEFYYPEHRTGEASPIAVQPFSMNLTDGEGVVTGMSPVVPGALCLKIAGGIVTVAPNWLFMSERTTKRPRPRPIAPKPPKVVKFPGGEPVA
jgi:hypothetical protein